MNDHEGVFSKTTVSGKIDKFVSREKMLHGPNPVGPTGRGAQRAFDKAGRLQEQLAGDKSRLEAEVDCLKAETGKVVESQ